MFLSILLWQQISLHILQCNRCGRLGFPQSFPSRTCLFHSRTLPKSRFHHQRRDSIMISIPVTSLMMMTDCHLQSWTDLRVPTGPSFYFWMLRCLEVKYNSRHEPPQFCPVPHRRGVVNYPVSLATVFVIPPLEHSLIK